MEQLTNQDPRAYSLYFVLKFDFGTEMLSGLSRNGPLVIKKKVPNSFPGWVFLEYAKKTSSEISSS